MTAPRDGHAAFVAWLRRESLTEEQQRYIDSLALPASGDSLSLGYWPTLGLPVGLLASAERGYPYKPRRKPRRPPKRPRP